MECLSKPFFVVLSLLLGYTMYMLFVCKRFVLLLKYRLCC